MTWITPAHAGKRKFSKTIKQKEKDHPRTCGEKSFNANSALVARGSPPHMRGKEFLDVLLDNPRRITPAHAGKSGIESYLPQKP